MEHNEHTTAVVLAGGGERVIAWQIGVLAGLADAGVDLRRAGSLIGTSAGACAAARLATGEDPRDAADRIAASYPEPVAAPDTRPFDALAQAFESAGTVVEGRRRVGGAALTARTEDERRAVARVAERVPARWPDHLRLVAVDAERGERVVLDNGSGASLAAGVAASRAIPGVVPPITVAGRRLMDGAIGSATNADAVLDSAERVDRVVIIAGLPIGPPYERLGRLWDEALRGELWQLDSAGIETYIVRATPRDLEAMGPDMVSGNAGPTAVLAGRRAGQAVGPALRRVLHPAPPRPERPARRQFRPRVAASFT
jgi:NTE family protein